MSELKIKDRVRVYTGGESFKGTIIDVQDDRIFVTEDGFYSPHSDSPFHRRQCARLVKKPKLNLGTFVRVPGCDFEIANAPCTQTLWETVMGTNPAHFKGPLRPAESVSWDDCQEFIAKLNARKDGFTYSLPTDKQWMKCFGRDLATDEEVMAQAWVLENSDRQTHDVCTRVPNEFGIYDMRGNVWEWTSTPESSYRGIRGGGWYSGARYARLARRLNAPPGGRDYDLGFRFVRTNP